jgi:glutamate-1-semialdehyde 2,1-aminomutase
MRNYEKSINIYKNAVNSIPGGVNSPVRAFKAVNRDPVFIKSAKGSKLFDEDGNEYIDYIGSWGPMILGHNHEFVVEEVKNALNQGSSSFGLPTKQEIELAELIKECMPSIDKVRLTTSGTEAAMAAVRLARAYTQRNKIIKFEGCYHGHSDSLLVKAGSGALTFDTLDSNGVTEGVVKDTITLPFNDIESLDQAFEENENQIAAVILEPIAANMGVIIPRKEFIQKTRDLTKKNGAILIFDEVITGFRIGLGGAQAYFDVNPDLTILGKIIGGGYPIGAFAGKDEIMNHIAPEGKVYHAGTLSGNPISVTAGLATVRTLKENPSIYEKLEGNVNYLVENVRKSTNELNLEITVNSIASLFTIFFTDREILNLSDVTKADREKFAKYFNTMLDNGVLVPPSQFEAHFVSAAHEKEDIEKTITVINEAFNVIRE